MNSSDKASEKEGGIEVIPHLFIQQIHLFELLPSFEQNVC